MISENYPFKPDAMTTTGKVCATNFVLTQMRSTKIVRKIPFTVHELNDEKKCNHSRT